MTDKTDYGFLENIGYNRASMIEQALYFSLSDEEREQLESNKDKAIKAGSFYDAVNNPLFNFGSNTADPSFNGLSITSKRNISWQITKLDSMMRDIPYFDKASSWKATRALINGVDITSNKEAAEDLVQVQKDIASLFSALHSTIKWGDYYGGSGGLIVTDDTISEEDYMKPLTVSDIRKGSFRGVKPLSRLYQVQPDLTAGLVTRVGDDIGIYYADEIGQPLYYQVNISGDKESNSKYFKVHRSRLLLYNSIDLTWVEKRIEMYFGPSLLERVYSDFARYESLLAQINKLAQRSNIPVLNMQNLPQASLNGQRFAEYVTSRVKGINFGVSSGGLIVLGDIEKEKFEYQNAQFAEIPTLLKQYRENLAAALGAPTSILFNDVESNDEEKYLSSIKEVQERTVRVWFRKLIPIIFKNRFGKSLKDFDFAFKSLEMPTEKEKAEKMKVVVEWLSMLYDRQIIDVESFQHMLIAMPNNVSDIPNDITQDYLEYIKKLSRDGKPMNKMSVDISLAKALNQASDDGDEQNESPTSNKVEAGLKAKLTGGNRTKGTVKVPIDKEKPKRN
jgi:phage-related protein (TIGR01555 family)